MQRVIKNNKTRKPIKSILRREDIHKKFQQQCLSRIRKDREKKFWERRNNSILIDEEMEDDITEFQKILKEEWDKFKVTYEYYGDLSIEELEEIEQEMKNESEAIDREYLELLNYEEQMLENTIESYQNNKIITCPVCENGNLFEDIQLKIIKCSNCSLEISNNQFNIEMLEKRINELQMNH
eukprot:jgi/Orpsp1_1/1189422/evm.model.d7180000071926.1